MKKKKRKKINKSTHSTFNFFHSFVLSAFIPFNLSFLQSFIHSIFYSFIALLVCSWPDTDQETAPQTPSTATWLGSFLEECAERIQSAAVTDWSFAARTHSHTHLGRRGPIWPRVSAPLSVLDHIAVAIWRADSAAKQSHDLQAAHAVCRRRGQRH